MLGIAHLINEASTLETADDHEGALRIYKTAFNNLLNVNSQITVSNANVISCLSPFEIRTLADYINHQICHFQFLMNRPREAITQFKKYIDVFKQHTRSPEYAFEHSAWLSQQYFMFAVLFEQAAASGIKISKSQHPGYYFQEAAIQTIERRKRVTEYTNDSIRSSQIPVTNEVLSEIVVDDFALFLRRCGWICIDSKSDALIKPSISPPYQDFIIDSLQKSAKHFEGWNRPRILCFINVLIANEYILMHEYQKALALFNSSLSTYLNDQWLVIAQDIKDRILYLESYSQSF